MRFDVIKHHRWWFTLSSILVIASLVSIFVRGFNLSLIHISEPTRRS